MSMRLHFSILIFSIFGGIFTTSAWATSFDVQGSCVLNIDGIGRGAVRACARNNAEANAHQACSGRIVRISLHDVWGSCKVIGDMTVACEARAEGECDNSAATVQQVERQQQRQAEIANQLATVAAQVQVGSPKGADDENDRRAAQWINRAKSGRDVCDFLIRYNPAWYKDDCLTIRDKVKLSRHLAKFCMVVATQYPGIGVDCLKDMDGLSLSPANVQIATDLARHNPVEGLDYAKKLAKAPVSKRLAYPALPTHFGVNAVACTIIRGAGRWGKLKIVDANGGSRSGILDGTSGAIKALRTLEQGGVCKPAATLPCDIRWSKSLESLFISDSSGVLRSEPLDNSSSAIKALHEMQQAGVCPRAAPVACTLSTVSHDGFVYIQDREGVRRSESLDSIDEAARTLRILQSGGVCEPTRLSSLDPKDVSRQMGNALSGSGGTSNPAISDSGNQNEIKTSSFQIGGRPASETRSRSNVAPL